MTGRSEVGDTLLEVLIAMLVIALTVTALMGALMTAITSSSEHRSLSTLDNILSSFAQSVEAEVQGKPNPSTPLFLNCPTPSVPGVVSPYTVLSAPIPAVGPTSTQVTVFLSGWAPGTVRASIGGMAPTSYKSSTNVPSTGDLALTFVVPALGPGPQGVAVAEGANPPVTSPTPFVFSSTASAGTNSLTGSYSMGITSVDQWDTTTNPPTFDNAQPCAASGMQRITATATGPGGESATTSFIVFGTAATTVAVKYLVPPSPASPVLENDITFQATVIPPTGTTPPVSGSITWVLTGDPSQTCQGTTPPNVTPVGSGSGNTGVATCVIHNALAGNYTVTAKYGGDLNYPATTGTVQQIVSRIAPSGVGITSSTPVIPGGSVTFTATVGYPTSYPVPQGSVTWAVSGPNGSVNCGGGNLANLPSGSNQSTCTITVSTGAYSVKALYNSDPNYLSQSSAPYPLNVSPVALQSFTVVGTFTSGRFGTTLTFKATATPPAGGPAPGGQVTFASSPTADPGNLPCVPTTPVAVTGNPGTAQCVITNPLPATYTVTANYGNSLSYTPATATASAILPAGSDIQGVPKAPADGKPDAGDQVVYTFNQPMDPNSIANQTWDGSTMNVYGWFSRSGSTTVMTVCTSRTFCNGGNSVNLGSVSLGDSGATHYTGSFGSVILNATMSMATIGGKSVVTVTLGTVAQGSGNPTAVSGTTTLTWTPSANATTPPSAGGTPCSTAPVTESGSPKANF